MPLARPRRFNRRIEIELPTRTPNGAGGFEKGWAAPIKVWAEMQTIRGSKEALEHMILKEQQLWKVTIRYRADVNSDARIKYLGKPLNIRSCQDPNGMFQELVMTCESGVNT